MPTVHIYMVEGRTTEQKRRLAQKVTAAVSEAIDVLPASVDVIMHEGSAHDFARGGTLVADLKQLGT